MADAEFRWYNIPLSMPVWDIVKEYREARYPSLQIDILADMNDTKSTRIAWLLTRAGCSVAANKLPSGCSKFIALWENSDEAKEADRLKEELYPEQQQPVDPPEPEPVPEERPEPEQPTIEKLDAAKLASTIAGFWNTYLLFRLDFPMQADMRHMLTGKDVQRMLELVDMAKDMLQEEE